MIYLGCRAKTGQWHWDDDKSPSTNMILMEELYGYNNRITVEFLTSRRKLILKSLWFCDPATFEIVRAMRSYSEPVPV